MDGKTIVDAWVETLYHKDKQLIFADEYHDLIQSIDAALSQARAEEREACANVAEYAPRSGGRREDVGLNIAVDIRGRRT